MKKLFYVLIILCFVGDQPCHTMESPFVATSPDIVCIESNNLEDVFQYIEEGAVVIFDLDGTVMEPLQMLGSDPWAYYYGDKLIALHRNKKKGLDAFVPVWQWVQKNIEMKLVDERLISVLERIKCRGACVMGFTARGIALAERTSEQLNAIEVDLTRNCYYRQAVAGDGFLFTNGVLFVDVGVDKGIMFKRFCDKIGNLPSKIIFLDDQAKNITYVKNMCIKHGIPFVGMRYGRADATKENFDPAISDIQLSHLQKTGKILSDKEASELTVLPEPVFVGQ